MDDLKIDIPQKNLIVTTIIDGLRDAIISGKFKPGERLKESEIADQLKVSRSPVREALRSLELDGIVELVPWKGAFVRKITRKEVTDLYEVKEMIEGFAARRIAENGSAQDILELEEIWKQMEILVNKNIDEYLKENSNFHKAVVSKSQNKKLEQIYLSLLGPIELFRSFGIRQEFRLEESFLRQHLSIVEAIKSKDGNTAEKLSREHVQGGRDHILSLMRK